MVVQLFTDPKPFLQRQAATGRLLLPTVIVLVVSVALTLQAAAIYYAAGQAVDEIINAVILLGLYYFMQGIALWIGFSFAFYILAALLGGYPLLGHLFRVVAWGMIPLIVTPAVWALGRYYALRNTAVPSPERTGSIEAEIAAMNEYTAQASGDPVLVGSVIAGSLLVAVSCYLWSVGLVRSGELSRRRAAIAAVVPTAAFIGWQLLGVL